MNTPEYYLFIDTETSGMPKRWSVSTQKVDQWPYILQIAWVIYAKTGEKVLFRNFYINAGNIAIDEQSLQLHGITAQFIQEKGMKRRKVMQLLAKDLGRYQPLIVGHFLEFDRRMLEVGFTRAKVKQNFAHLPKFCTMVFSQNLRQASFTPKYMRLDELYFYLFNTALKNHHDAFHDALATKEIFFELLRRGVVTSKTIDQQQRNFKPAIRKRKIFLVMALVAAFMLLLYYLLLTWK